MAVNVIGTIKPKNNGDFPIVEAVDVSVSEDLRLPEALEAKADASALASTNATVATKANASEVNSSLNNLQGQINQIEISATAEAVVAPEVAAARVGDNGTEYDTLKVRLDSENALVTSNISSISEMIGIVDEYTEDIDVGNVSDYGQPNCAIGNEWHEGSNNNYVYAEISLTDNSKKFSVTIFQHAGDEGSYICGTDINNNIVCVNTPIIVESNGYVTYTVEMTYNAKNLIVTSYHEEPIVKVCKPVPIQDQIDSIITDATDMINEGIGTIKEDLVSVETGVLNDYGRSSCEIGKKWSNGSNEHYKYVEIAITDLYVGKKFRIKINQYKNTSGSYICGVDSNDIIVCINSPVTVVTSTTYVTYDFEITEDTKKIIVTSYNVAPEVSVYLPVPIQDQIDSISTYTSEIPAIQNKVFASRMKFGAHQGARFRAPANTPASYMIAGKEGWDYAWIAGCRQSADGTWYVLHDASVDSTTNGEGNIAELHDAYIDSLISTVESPDGQYLLSDFTDDEKRVPTLEEVIQICITYNMAMCFRLNSLPAISSTEESLAVWNDFLDLIRSYNALSRPSIFAGSGAQLRALGAIEGTEDYEFCMFINDSATAQDYIDGFYDYEQSAAFKNKSCIIHVDNLSLENVKKLHKKGIKVYAYTPGSRYPTNTELINCATWGVDIFQNGNVHAVPLN